MTTGCSYVRWLVPTAGALVVLAGCSSSRGWPGSTTQKPGPPNTVATGESETDDAAHRGTHAGNTRPGAVTAEEPREDNTIVNQPVDLTPVTVMFLNGEAITADEVLRPIRPALERRAQSMPVRSYQMFLVEAASARIRAVARDRLLYQEASKGIGDDEWEHVDKFVDQRIRDIINADYQGRQTRYEKALAEQGLSLEEGREQVRRMLVVQRYLYQTVRPRVTHPTRAQLWQHFQKKKAEMVKPPRREMYLIEITRNAPLDIVPAEGGDTRPVDAATAIAMARAELDRHVPFADVARKFSTGIHAAEGGYWGFVHRDSLRERFQPAVDALFELPAGESSDVLEGPDAFFIVKCGAIDPGAEADFAAMQPQLMESYRDDQFDREVDELVAKLREKAVIEPDNLARFLRGVVEAAPQAKVRPADGQMNR